MEQTLCVMTISTVISALRFLNSVAFSFHVVYPLFPFALVGDHGDLVVEWRQCSSAIL